MAEVGTNRKLRLAEAAHGSNHPIAILPALS
jgi:hypothetical protein